MLSVVIPVDGVVGGRGSSQRFLAPQLDRQRAVFC